MGSPRAASEFLARAGIDGVKYPVDSYGGKGVKDGDKAGWNYVSFRDDNIRVDHKWTDGQLMYSRGASKDGNEYSYASLTARPDMPLVKVNAARAKQYGDNVSLKLADARKSIVAAGGRVEKGHYVIAISASPRVGNTQRVRIRGAQEAVRRHERNPALPAERPQAEAHPQAAGELEGAAGVSSN